ncbi:hypothetical protein Rs2_41079 [Raphanus sativus]|nr:hypothetical protein Rs2_41079 [Raphanus sativus]
MIAEADFAIACRKEPCFKYRYQLDATASIDRNTATSNDKAHAEHREEFTKATPPDPYSRADMEEKLKAIYNMQEDSLNDFKWKLDSIYHPLNDKITWLTASMESLTNHIMKQKTRESQA